MHGCTKFTFSLMGGGGGIKAPDKIGKKIRAFLPIFSLFKAFLGCF